MRTCIPVVGALLAAACGATPPDYEALEQIQVNPDFACGGEYTAADLVRLAYDADPYALLPLQADVPEGSLQAGTVVVTGVRRFPCAPDADAGAAALREVGYEDVAFRSRSDRLLVYDAEDPYGIPGTYTAFDCGYVEELAQGLSGSYFSQGLFGTLADGTFDYETAAEFAHWTFRTGLTMVTRQAFGTVTEGRPVYLGIEPALVDRELGAPDARPSLRLCAAWVEPNIWGGCDLVRLGESITALEPDPEDGVHQFPLISAPIAETTFVGWCNRDE